MDDTKYYRVYEIYKLKLGCKFGKIKSEESEGYESFKPYGLKNHLVFTHSETLVILDEQLSDMSISNLPH